MSTRHSFLSTTGLVRGNTTSSTYSSGQANSGGTKTGKNKGVPDNSKAIRSRKIVTHAGVIPLGPTFLVVIAFIFSLFFIASISFAFVGAEDEPTFKGLLEDIAHNSPGIVLVGDSVDVDIDEPAITIRWTMLGCGQEYMLSGSEGSHGTNLCGLPSMPLNIFVDGDESPTAIYDPSRVPFAGDTGQRRSIQNMQQFDSDHVLDVHAARLYPFDSYVLTSNIRVVSGDTDESIPIVRLPTMTQTSSFLITANDAASYIDDVQNSSRDLTLGIQRPGEARAFALLLFAVNWVLAHASIAYILLIWKLKETEKILKYLALAAASLLIIPQLRGSMPDAPGFDGVLIDSIGFFPQMLITGCSVTLILASIAKRELELFAVEEEIVEKPKEAPAPLSHGLRRLRLAGSKASIDIRSSSRNFTRVEPPSPVAERF